MIVGIHQPQYLPWLGIIDRVLQSDIFVMLDNVPYSKNYFYNRNRIKTANGWNWLTVPVLFKGKFGTLIKDVKIDALHSFEDVCCPIIEYKKRYGSRIAVLGGVDMDKLCRLDEENLRKYVKNILEECMTGGRFALGAGNTIANYVPLKNYFIMLDEGLKWK